MQVEHNVASAVCARVCLSWYRYPCRVGNTTRGSYEGLKICVFMHRRLMYVLAYCYPRYTGLPYIVVVTTAS